MWQWYRQLLLGGRQSPCTAPDSCRGPHPLSAFRPARLLAQRRLGRGAAMGGAGVAGPGVAGLGRGSGRREELSSLQQLYDCLRGGLLQGGHLTLIT